MGLHIGGTNRHVELSGMWSLQTCGAYRHVGLHAVGDYRHVNVRSHLT